MDYLEFRERNRFSVVNKAEIENLKDSLCQLFWGDRPIEKIDELNVIPEVDPLYGTIGYTIFREESGKELMSRILLRFAKVAVEIVYNSPELFDRAFKRAWDSDKPIVLHEDPEKRRFGFIVSGRESREWHSIPVSCYKD